jgi:hypothetical protein
MEGFHAKMAHKKCRVLPSEWVYVAMFSQCLGTVVARQILIGNVIKSWYTKRKNACVYTFEQEFSTSLLHMRSIGFKSSAYYTQM